MLDELIQTYEELSIQIEELEKKKKELSATILQQMQEKSLRVSDYLVRRYSRLSIQIPLEKARSLGATKMEEVVDKEKIKILVEQLGQSIDGVSEIKYITVTKNK